MMIFETIQKIQGACDYQPVPRSETLHWYVWMIQVSKSGSLEPTFQTSSWFWGTSPRDWLDLYWIAENYYFAKLASDGLNRCFGSNTYSRGTSNRSR